MHRLLLTFLALCSALFVFSVVSADTDIEEIKEKISTKGQEIERLEEEIDLYKREIVKVQAKSSSLESTINELDWTRRKLNTDIDVTNTQIENSNYTIQRIDKEISITTDDIQRGNQAIANLMQSMYELESHSLVEIVLANEDLSDFWNDIESLHKSRETIEVNLKDLEQLKLSLQEMRMEGEMEKEELELWESKLIDQKKVVDYNKREQTTLLTETKSKESTYQKMLATKKAAKDAFEQELADYESQLQYILDEEKLPTVGSGVLSHPLQEMSHTSCYGSGIVYGNCITQYFGNTDFAQTGAYNGKGHNGVDFRAATGEPLYAPASGNITGIGNTDLIKGCYSYGKWILMAHDNGLATAYGHLSVISVNEGDYVRRGDIIGYTGNTGYSTGPHLHMNVYAGDAVKVLKLSEWRGSTNCGNAEIPVAAYSAYLNPLDYLAE